MAYKYKVGILGGTFDKLHEGHKAFLRYAFSLSETIYVTLTSDIYTQKNKPLASQFIEREKVIKSFLDNEKLLSRAKIIPIDDVYGIAADKNISFNVIFATKDTLRGAELVNERRKFLNLPPLDIKVVPLLSGEIGLPISSTYIKENLFDSKGQLKIKKKLLKESLYLPEKLRKTLHKPFGKIYAEPDQKFFTESGKIIAVGDVTVRILHKKNLFPVISVIDFVVERKKQPKSLTLLGFNGENSIIHAQNPAGMITPSLWEALNKAFTKIPEKKSIVIVYGEEDLAVLPSILMAPIGYIICYGQPHEGMIIINVDKNSKERALRLINALYTTRGY